MVDVTGKARTARRAAAEAIVAMRPEVLAQIMADGLPKGDVLGVARVAGIQAAKRTSELIPLCHPIALTKVGVEFEGDERKGLLRIRAEALTADRTGVEMEALTAASVAALTVYDMCKAAQRDMVIRSVRLMEKSGGKSGTFRRKEGDE